jgi:hypothetical protein
MRFITYDDVEDKRETYEDYIISGAIHEVLHLVKDLSWQSDYPHVRDFIKDIHIRYGGSNQLIAIFDFIRNNI